MESGNENFQWARIKSTDLNPSIKKKLLFGTILWSLIKRTGNVEVQDAHIHWHMYKCINTNTYTDTIFLHSACLTMWTHTPTTTDKWTLGIDVLSRDKPIHVLDYTSAICRPVGAKMPVFSLPSALSVQFPVLHSESYPGRRDYFLGIPLNPYWNSFCPSSNERFCIPSHTASRAMYLASYSFP